MLSAARFRRFHRRLSVFVGIQILLWTVGGIYFAWTDIDEIRGDHHRRAQAPVALGRDWISPAALDFEGAGRDRPASVVELDLVSIGETTYYRLRDESGEPVLADVRDGSIRGPLSREEAVSLARESYTPEAQVASVTFLEASEVGAHHEYRGGALPAWVVEFDHQSGTRVYVAALEGEVTKHRNAQWRVFDLLWMLHTMDYLGRDDFNNPVLRTVAVLGIATVLSGYLLWGWTAPALRGRRRRTVTGPRPAEPPS